MSRTEVSLQELDHSILADGVLGAPVACGRHLLDQGLCIPDQPIVPGAIRWMDVPVHDGQVHALGFAMLELLHQRVSRVRVFGKDDEA